MSARAYDASGANNERTKQRNKANVFRDEQRFIELDASSDLTLKAVLKLLPPLRKKDKDWPCVVVIGDGATLDDDAYAKQQAFFQNGLLRAAFSLQAHVFDNGLGSSIAVGSASAPNVTDFGRDVFHVGMMPCCDDPPSQFTTHQIVLNDFDGWEDRPKEFAQQKFSFLRRLNGNSCRTVCVVFNAGPSAFEEAAEACRLGMPVIVMKGSGELADELANAQEGNSGGGEDALQSMVDSSCLYVFDADAGRPCDLATLIRCHCLTDIVGMTRMINDLDPVASVMNSTPYFEGGKPASQIRSRVGTKGKLKYIGKTRGGGLKKNRRYKVVSYQMTANRMPTPPKGSISKGGIFKKRNLPPAGNIPPLSSAEPEPAPEPDEAKEVPEPEPKPEPEPEPEQEDSEPDAADDPITGLDDSSVLPGAVIEFTPANAPTSTYKKEHVTYFAKVLKTEVADSENYRLNLTVDIYGSEFLEMPKHCPLFSAGKKIKMKTIKKRGTNRTETFKGEQFSVVSIALSYDISRYKGKPLRYLQWQGGHPKMYNQVELPSHNLNSDGEKYVAAVKIQSRARRMSATVKVEEVRKENSGVGDADTATKKAAAIKIQSAERRREAMKEVQRMREEKARKEAAGAGDAGASDGDANDTEADSKDTDVDSNAVGDSKDDDANADGKSEGGSDADTATKEAAAIKIQSAERRREAMKEVQKMREEKVKKEAAEGGGNEAEDANTDGDSKDESVVDAAGEADTADNKANAAGESDAAGDNNDDTADDDGSEMAMM